MKKPGLQKVKSTAHVKAICNQGISFCNWAGYCQTVPGRHRAHQSLRKFPEERRPRLDSREQSRLSTGRSVTRLLTVQTSHSLHLHWLSCTQSRGPERMPPAADLGRHSHKCTQVKLWLHSSQAYQGIQREHISTHLYHLLTRLVLSVSRQAQARPTNVWVDKLSGNHQLAVVPGVDCPLCADIPQTTLEMER